MFRFLLFNTILFVDNRFNGSLPDLTNLMHLSVFDGSNNHFEGNIASLLLRKFPKTLNVLQLSNNNIKGSFSEKYCLNFHPAILDLSGNKLGNMSDASLRVLFCICFAGQHSSVDMSRNPQFSAALPDCVLNHKKSTAACRY
jgi:hypothetical protein